MARLQEPGAPAFALLQRRTPRLAPDKIEVLIGEAEDYETLADLPVTSGPPASRTTHHDLLALVPYRQLRERGFEVHDDGTPLRALRITEQHVLSLQDALQALPREPVELRGGAFSADDNAYDATVRRILEEEIGRGEGANFVIRRDFTATVDNFSPAVALTLFRRLLEQEQGAYWTFLVHTGDRVLVGASPEVHVRQANGIVVMNPISGTYRYPAEGPSLPSLMDFLDDAKEREELTMVVDEELKMMCTIGDLGGQVLGPRLKEMAHLAHTEYELRGRTSLDVREVLRQTMFAATVTGSPLQNAARVIARHEQTGRGFYAGALALIGRNASGGQMLDSPICIRTADIDAATGRLSVGVGATLVRGSDPASEVAETHAKAAGILSALGAAPSQFPRRHPTPRLADDHRVQAALNSRRAALAPFWLHEQRPVPASEQLTLVVDAEDTFTAMLAHLLSSLGHRVTVLRHDAPGLSDMVDNHEGLVVLGPGPGDPSDSHDARIAALRALAGRALARPVGAVFAVCLGHQLVAARLGLLLHRLPVPHQGVQEVVDLFGKHRKVGFYNTFTARCSDTDAARLAHVGVEVARDPRTGNVHALRGVGLASVQFHPESVLTREGIDIAAELLRDALDGLSAPAAERRGL
ncbi:anthranilate synthase family protein [Streptomyces sp. NPDC051909]|uniref:anthranilate synthase family protein n=1 Tax=Streptomyces sp. NPDC051909 TaxID=3154944 RepID=UPI00342C6096